MLTRDAILGAQDVKRERVEVPEWGGFVFVSMMTGTERDAFEASLVVGGKTSLLNARAKLAVRCITDDTGKRVFGDEDIEALGEKSAAALDRVIRKAQSLNRITDGDLEDLKGN